MQTFGESNMGNSPDEKKRIIHATLKSDSFVFMASDARMDQKTNFGDSVSLSLQGEDQKKFTEIFNKISQGGTIAMPLAKQFWGATFGMVTDKFGIHWMVNIEPPKSNAP